jgi:outer membrane usher protein
VARDSAAALFAALTLLAAHSARGDERVAALGAPGASEPKPTLPPTAPVWLDLSVNGVEGGTVLVQLGGGDAWVADEDLSVAGMKIAPVTGERLAGVGGRSLVSLRSLAPRVSFEVDERALALRVKVTSETLFGRSSVNLWGFARPPGLQSRGEPAAFLNWAARVGTAREARSADAELGLTTGSEVLLSGATMDSKGRVVRGLTTAYRDDVPAVIRYAAGDVVSSSWDPLGGSALLGGVAAWREFSLDPYLVRVPFPSTSVFASTPSTLEVWVNGALVRRVPVNPGTVDLQNIPTVAGANEVRTVLRDAFGREQGTGSIFSILGSRQLAPGLLDFGGWAGFRREQYGVASLDYGGGPAALGLARMGVTAALTLGGRLEAADGVVSGGPSASVATALGEVSGSLAASNAAGGSGAAVDVAWRWPGRAFTAGVSARLQSPSYANLSQAAAADRASAQVSAAASIPIVRRLSLLLEGSAARWRDEPGTRATGAARAMLGLGHNLLAGFSVTRGYDPSTGSAWGIFASLSIVLPGANGSAEVATQTGSAGSGAQLSAQRPLPAGPGLGYRVLASAGDGSVASATLQAQAAPGRLEARYDAVDPWSARRSSGGAIEAAGGVVLVGGKLFATRPVKGSFTILSVPGLEGVTGYRDNQPVGKTDADGDLFIPDLTAHLAHRISIRDTDVPMDYRISQLDRLVAPTFRSGTVERFAVFAMHALTGRLTLTLEGKNVIPEFGEIAVETPAGRVVSPIGGDGAFWLDGLPVGRVEALVRWEGRLCRLTFDVGEKAGVVDVGAQICSQMLAEGLGGSPAGAD